MQENVSSAATTDGVRRCAPPGFIERGQYGGCNNDTEAQTPTPSRQAHIMGIIGRTYIATAFVLIRPETVSYCSSFLSAFGCLHSFLIANTHNCHMRKGRYPLDDPHGRL